MLAGGALHAQQGGASPRLGAPPSLIDVHHHVLPPAYMTAVRDRMLAQAQAGVPAAVLDWNPQRALAEMDRNGVSTAILSISTPGIWFGNIREGRALARQCNEYSAQLVRDHPGRFGFFASIPLPDTDGSLREIAHALDTLHADGTCLMTNYGDKWPGDPAYAPVFEELNRRGAVVYFHPNIANCCRDLMPYLPFQVLELAHEDTRAIASLLFSGALPRYRNIRFIFSHAGGELPMAAARIARQASARKELAGLMPDGAEAELKRLYYEIAGSANRPAWAALAAFAPKTRILFGSDYPWLPLATTAGDFAALDLTAADRQSIGRENAVGLLPRFRR
jgi:predicted TIM-barrel fold metal-dependent hydrolase